jgi:4-hydroxy-4-methyl-2-oxoglutarate aldolase
VLDGLGFRRQCLPYELVPLLPGTVLVGRAFTVSVAPVDAPPETPYRGLLRALDALGRDDVYVISSGASREVALWGELVSTAARARGAVGALCDGCVRDVAAVRALGFPVFARGTVPYDIHGRLEVTGTGDPVEIGGIDVIAGELIVGDDDGVVIVPREVEAEAIARAVDKASAETRFREAVNGGMAPSEAYALHQVL